MSIAERPSAAELPDALDSQTALGAASSQLSPRTAKHPPGPASPWFGWKHLQRLRSDFLGHLTDLQAQYGDAVSYRIGPLRVFQFSHPDQIEELLVKRATSFHKVANIKRYFGRWMGAGLLLNEGADWRVQRRKVRWALAQLDGAAQVAAVAQFASTALPVGRSETIDVAPAMDRLAFALNVQMLLGDDAAAHIDGLYEAANVLHSSGLSEMNSASLVPDWWPSAFKARLRAAMRLFDEVLLHQAQRRDLPSPQDASTDAPADGLRLLRHAHDRQEKTVGMSARRARDEAVNLLMGGKETVSATLTFALYLLAQHPAVQQQAAAEIRAVLAGRRPQPADVERLPLVQNIVQETMRLFPPVYAISRQAIEPVQIAGYTIGRGSLVMAPVWSIQRDVRWWQRPNEFLPERFAIPTAQRRPYAYLPFGAGPRSCVGKHLGYEQCVLALAVLLDQHQFALPADAGDLRLATDIVLHPADPLRLKLSPRAPLGYDSAI